MNRRYNELLLRIRTAAFFGLLVFLCSLSTISWLACILAMFIIILCTEWRLLTGKAFAWPTLFYPIFPFAILCIHTVQAQTWLTMMYPWIIAWTADTGAYFTGISIGKHKLWPKISPGKTWEGLIGGMLSVFLLQLVLTHQNLVSALCWAILFVSAATAGDLYVSYKKRHALLKDTGSLLPGHGGLLDRIDSVLGVAPLTYLFLFW